VGECRDHREIETVARRNELVLGFSLTKTAAIAIAIAIGIEKQNSEFGHPIAMAIPIAIPTIAGHMRYGFQVESSSQ